MGSRAAILCAGAGRLRARSQTLLLSIISAEGSISCCAMCITAQTDLLFTCERSCSTHHSAGYLHLPDTASHLEWCLLSPLPDTNHCAKPQCIWEGGKSCTAVTTKREMEGKVMSVIEKEPVVQLDLGLDVWDPSDLWCQWSLSGAVASSCPLGKVLALQSSEEKTGQ